jgi:hypothetical protein
LVCIEPLYNEISKKYRRSQDGIGKQKNYNMEDPVLLCAVQQNHGPYTNWLLYYFANYISQRHDA